jgi:hypothetical protein
MKVLVTGRAIPKQPDRCTGQQLVEGFKQAGHEAYFYGCFYGDPMNFLGAEECQSVDNWDLVVYTEMNDGMSGYGPLFEYHKLREVPRLHWDFDVSYHPQISIDRVRAIEFDGYLVGNKYFLGDEGFGRLRKPVLHLPYACSPQIHRRLDDVKREYLIGFVGSLTDERKRLIEVCKETVSNSADVFAGEGFIGEDLITKTNEMSIMFHSNQDACKGLVPGRPWETTGCGTTLMMDRTSYEDFCDFLPEHLYEDILVYDNETDIRQLLSSWQNKRATLEMMGDSLRTYVHQNHTYKHRAEQIIEWAENESIIH